MWDITETSSKYFPIANFGIVGVLCCYSLTYLFLFSSLCLCSQQPYWGPLSPSFYSAQLHLYNTFTAAYLPQRFRSKLNIHPDDGGSKLLRNVHLYQKTAVLMFWFYSESQTKLIGLKPEFVNEDGRHRYHYPVKAVELQSVAGPSGSC